MKTYKYSMDDKFKNMTYDDFFYYCEERACDGRWSLEEALLCLEIIERLKNIRVYTRVYTFSFYNKNKTIKAREEEWNIIKKNIFKEGL
jgi:hypothetical protein